MENNCSNCLFFDKCVGNYTCDNFFFADEDSACVEMAFKLHNEYFNDFQSYLKEFYK